MASTLSPNNQNPHLPNLTPALGGFAEHFFGQAMRSGALVHAYVLKGQDMGRMYRCALDIAQRLNCEQPSTAPETGMLPIACGNCPSCRWVARNAHPAVITVSRLTYLVSDDGKDLTLDDLDKLAKKTPQTQIKTEQIGRLAHQLGMSSQYTRVVIFTDAEEGPASMTSTVLPPQDWAAVSANEKKSFHLKPLNRHLFNANSANRFLKTLEEPPPKTLFFFLTDSDESLLETIVSRCQVVPFGGAVASEATAPSYPHQAEALYHDQLQMCLSRQVTDIYAMTTTLNSVLCEELGLSQTQALQGFQRYLRQLYLQAQLDYTDYRRFEKALEHAITLLNSKTNAEQTLNHLYWTLTTGG